MKNAEHQDYDRKIKKKFLNDDDEANTTEILERTLGPRGMEQPRQLGLVLSKDERCTPRLPQQSVAAHSPAATKSVFGTLKPGVLDGENWTFVP